MLSISEIEFGNIAILNLFMVKLIQEKKKQYLMRVRAQQKYYD